MRKKITDNAKIKQKRAAAIATAKGYTSPDFTKLSADNADYRSELGYAYNYVNYMYEPKELKKFAEEFYGKSLSDIPDWEFVFIGNFSWLHNKGVWFAEEKVAEIRNRISKLETKYQAIKAAEQKPVSKDESTGNLIAELQGVIDDVMLSKTNITQPAKLVEMFPKANLSKVKDYFGRVAASVETETFATETDEKRIKAALKIIMGDLDKSAKQKPVKLKKARKPRKVVPSKMVRKLKFQQEDKVTGLKSILPESIVGAKVLWVYNTKKRKLGKYVAADDTGLLVKGSTILNYIEAESVQKKLRKPKEVLDKLMVAGKVEQRKILDSVKATAGTLNGRINKDTILVKV